MSSSRSSSAALAAGLPEDDWGHQWLGLQSSVHRKVIGHPARPSASDCAECPKFNTGIQAWFAEVVTNECNGAIPRVKRTYKEGVIR